VAEQKRDNSETLCTSIEELIKNRKHMPFKHRIQIITAQEGHAVGQLAVSSDMVNGHGLCHGGIINQLASVVLSAANSVDAHGMSAVIRTADITFCAAAGVGDRLNAECRRWHSVGRTKFYFGEVTNQTGEKIALVNARMVQTSSPGRRR
jgi:acyl-CoA thioesterase